LNFLFKLGVHQFHVPVQLHRVTGCRNTTKSTRGTRFERRAGARERRQRRRHTAEKRDEFALPDVALPGRPCSALQNIPHRGRTVLALRCRLAGAKMQIGEC
jgi:hypothetical protein